MADTSKDSWLNSPGIGGYGTYGYQVMMAAGVTAGIADIGVGINQATALGVQADFNRAQAQENIKRAGMQTAQLALETGHELGQAGSAANKVIGAQRAAYATQGVNVNTGAPMQEQTTEGAMSAQDSLAIMNNAALKAWGIETQATQTAGQQELEAQGEVAQGQQSILTGGAMAMNNLLAMQEESERERTRTQAGAH